MGAKYGKLAPRSLSFSSCGSRSFRRDPRHGSGGGSGNGRAGKGRGTASDSSNSAHTYTAELESYDEASMSDPDLRSFGSALQQRTQKAIDSISSDIPTAAVSLSSLRAVSSVLFETNCESVEVILTCGDEIQANRDLSRLVLEYIDSSIRTLKFCNSLINCLQKAKDRQLLLRLAITIFANHEDPRRHERTLEELRKFREAGDPFTEEFYELFRSVREQQEEMLRSLQSRRRNLDRKLRSVRAWRKISTVIFVSAFSALLICSVVAAAMVAPPVVTAVLSAGTVAMGPLGKWFASLWTGYEERLKEETRVVGMMEKTTGIVIEDLRSIDALVERFKGEMESILKGAEFAERGVEAVKVGVEEVERRMEEFTNCVEDLERQLQHCKNFVAQARTVVLRRLASREANSSG